MRVLIADDRSSVRAALMAVLELDPACEGVDEALDAAGALTALDFGADVMILEWGLPGLPPATLVGLARTQRPELIVVVLGRYSDAQRAALAAGADHYIDTSEPALDFVGVLHGLCPQWRAATRQSVPEQL